MNKRVLFLSITALIFFTTSLSAQPPEKKERPDHLKKLTEELSLTDDQVKDLKPVLKSFEEQLDKLHEAHKAERKKQKEEVKIIHDKLDAEIEKILTEAQKEKFTELKKKRSEGPPERERGQKKPRR